MKLIKPQVAIEGNIDGEKILKHIEKIGRVCYKSEDRITADSARVFAKSILDRGHLSVIEHANVSVRFVIDRGVSHELVRHRICSFSQESTRYVNYNKRGIEFILPPWATDIPVGEYGFVMQSNGMQAMEVFPEEYKNRRANWKDNSVLSQIDWLYALLYAEHYYNSLIQSGWKPQEARSVLPNALKTEIVTTANLREWRHMLKLRVSKAAHPQMREIMIDLLGQFKTEIPVLFDDISVEK